MAQFVEFSAQFRSETPDGIAGALFGFEVLRAQLAAQSTDEGRARRVRDEVVSARELAMLSEVEGIHDAMTGAGRLKLYRFFLLASQRNSLIFHRFDAQIVANRQQVASLERELAEADIALEQLELEFAEQSAPTDPAEARLLASDFLWIMAWWLYGRREVESFRFPIGDDVLTALLLGREPDSDEPGPRQMHECASRAERDYRRMLIQRSVTLKNVVCLSERGDFGGIHTPLHLRGDGHM